MTRKLCMSAYCLASGLTVTGLGAGVSRAFAGESITVWVTVVVATVLLGWVADSVVADMEKLVRSIRR